MTPEAKVKQEVKKILDNYKPDCWYFMPAARVFGTTGIPDFIGVFLGQFFSIETKAGNNKPTAMQIMQMKKIQAAGGIAIVVNENNTSEVIDMMGQIYELRKSG